MRKDTSNKRKSKARVDSAGAARSWLELGIQPVPLYPKSKRPSGGKGWTSTKVTEKTVDRVFSNGANLGGLWGEPSNWIVDIDLDWDEACDFAEHYLPETFTYGRRSRPDSHYLYRCKGAVNYKRSLKTGEVIAEIRSTGSQSVLPPSIHPDNERYEINQDLPFTPITKAELERYIDRVAAAALLLRYFPEKGSRHDFIHALCGALMWGGWTEEEAREFMNAFLESVRGSDEEIKDRRRTIESTVEHFKKGDRIAGWKTLGQWIDTQNLYTARQWLTPPKKFQTPPQLVKGEISITIPHFDPALLDVPGLVGEIARWAGRRSYLHQPAFDLSVGLMCTSLATCNKYVIQNWATPLQPYFMLLAPTAAGKGSALSSIYNFAAKVGLGEYVFQGAQSYHALLDRLSEPPNMACWLWDEAARRLKSTRNPSSFDYQLVTWLLALYGQANNSIPGILGRKAEIPALENPFLTLFAAAQPDQLIESVTVSDLAMGLLNRFILFDSGDDPPKSNLDRSEVFPSAVKRQVKDMKNYEPRNTPVEIAFETGGVWAAFRDFDEEARRHASEEGENEIWGRANQNALIVAGLVAVGVNHRRPVITPEIGRWSRALVRWGISCWSSRIGESAARSFREGASKTVERYIRNSRRYSHRAEGSNRELMQRGIMPLPVLQKLCRHLQKREFAEILDQLIDAELVACGEIDEVEVYWATR